MALFEYGHPRAALKGQMTWFFAWLAVTLIGACLSPSRAGHGTHEELGLPPCGFVLLFDRPCPGCGLTTSWTAFIHGHFAEAFHAHLLGPIMYVLFGISAFLSLYGYIKGAKFCTDTREFNRAMSVFIAVFLIFGAARMIVTPHYGSSSEHLFAHFAHL